MNYTGGKFKLLEQIKPLFPQKSEVFLDVFGGGLDVSINVLDISQNVIANDIVPQLIQLYEYFKENDPDLILETIKKRIEEFDLGRDNKEQYINFRENVYNKEKHILDFYILICHSFCNQIALNKDGDFKETYGQRTFNPAIEKRFIEFCERIKFIDFTNVHFLDFDYEILNENDFVYLDPPYLITEAKYNKSWSENEEESLYELLDLLNEMKVKFALSNVVEHKNKKNEILLDWSKRYNLMELNFDYKARNQNVGKSNVGTTKEVLVTNY